MPLNKLPTQALATDAVTADILADDSVDTNAVQVGDITADKLATSLDLSTKTITMNIEQMSNVSSSAPSTGQVLKWDGSSWAPGTDLTAAAGSGITLTDLSVSTATAGTASLSYDNSTGVFTYTPPDLTETIPLNDLSDVVATSPSNGNIIKWNSANSRWEAGNETTGITLADISVTTNSPATAGLSYNNTNGVFTYTPPNLSSYLTSVSQNDVSQHQAALSITESQISNLQTYLLANSRVDFIALDEVRAVGTINANVLTMDVNTASILRVTSNPSADFTLAMTNMPISGKKVVNAAVMVDQGATGYFMISLTINGVAQTINWQNNIEPRGYANHKDIIAISVFCDGTTYDVFANLTTYGA